MRRIGKGRVQIRGEFAGPLMPCSLISICFEMIVLVSLRTKNIMSHNPVSSFFFVYPIAAGPLPSLLV